MFSLLIIINKSNMLNINLIVKNINLSNFYSKQFFSVKDIPKWINRG